MRYKKDYLKFLNKLIDDLWTVGVDVSYFPDEAKEVLENAAQTLEDETEELLYEENWNRTVGDE